MKQNTLTTPHTGVSRVVLALALAGSCAVAQAATADDELELAPVTVSAHDGNAVPYDRTGVSVTVLDIDELKKEGITNLSDALTTVPGLYVLPGGGLNQRGNVSNLVIRGQRADACTLPMIDGMRLNSTGGSGLVTANVLARANMFDLGNAEILRGAQGAAYGGGNMGGVLFMETPEGMGEPTYSVFNEGGSHDSYTGNVTAQGKTDKLGYFVSATYDRTNNDLQKADGSRFEHKHAGRYVNWAEAVRLDYDITESSKATFTYRREDAEFTRASSDYDWMAWPPVPMDTFSTYTFMSNLITGKVQSKVDEHFTTQLMAGYYGSDYNLSSDTYPFYTNIRNVQVEWRNAYKWNEEHTTTGGFAWERSQYTADDGAGKRNTSRNLENVYSVFAEHTATPIKNWDNSLALRWDRSSVFDNKYTYRFATNYKFNKETSRVFGSVGHGYRSPSAFQRSTAEYNNGYSITRGNPMLRGEHSINADFGFEQQFCSDHYASATLFWNRTENGIATFYEDYSHATFYNQTGHNTCQGIELALHGTLEKAWNTGYRFSCTLTQPMGPNDVQLSETARQVWSADIHTSPIEKLTLGCGLSAASGRHNVAGYPTPKLDAYYTLRLYAQYEVNEHLTFHVRVENVTDQKFVTECPYTAAGSPDRYNESVINAGASIYGGMTVKF